MIDPEIEAFLALYLPSKKPKPLRLTVTRRPERTKDSLARLLAAGRQYLRLAQEDFKP